jgi:hypothetical protein
MTIRIFRPDGAIFHPPHRISPGRPTLDGARIGVLDNGKWNAGLLMTTVANELAAKAGTAPPLVLVKHAAFPAPAEHIERLAKEVDLVITGSAD